MRRRALLASVAAAVSGGCLGRGGGGYGAGGDGDRESKSLVDTSLSVTDAGCGTIAESAIVSFSSEETRVVVQGTTTGADSCRFARLAASEYDADTGELALTVETYAASEGPCTECLVEIEYEAMADFEGGLPERVVVVHDSQGGRREVATASR
jgi:ABC-type glycerol-3-phosphate transport system substrate-binding protein